jgi:hypothetical protein
MATMEAEIEALPTPSGHACEYGVQSSSGRGVQSSGLTMLTILDKEGKDEEN